MANRKQPSQAEEQAKKSVELEKKLHKREKRLQARLLAAQERQVKALERFIKADTRLRKRTALVERLEDRLANVRQHLRQQQEQQAEPANQPQASETDISEGASSEGTLLPAITEASPSSLPPTREIPEQVREARAAASAAEDNVRQASERAAQISSLREQPDANSHAEGEATVTPDEISAVGEEQPVQQDHTANSENRSVQGKTEREETQSEVDDRETWDVERQLTTPLLEEQRASQVKQEPVTAQQASIEEIEEDEDVVAAVAAMMIADVAAASAAKAEAIAEASSARTREARYAAIEADQVLEEVRSAITSGAISGEEAERFLQSAEREATRAQALLADAEAAEEQARNAAMNAEAEAEVAEGMAFAASNQSKYADLSLEESAVSTQSLTYTYAHEKEGLVQDVLSLEKGVPGDDEDESDDTEELPAITDQERV